MSATSPTYVDDLEIAAPIVVIRSMVLAKLIIRLQYLAEETTPPEI